MLQLRFYNILFTLVATMIMVTSVSVACGHSDVVSIEESEAESSIEYEKEIIPSYFVVLLNVPYIDRMLSNTYRDEYPTVTLGVHVPPPDVI